MFVQGELEWVKVNPGSQTARIGSFHPITEGDWTEGAYVSPATNELCLAVTKDDVATVTKLLDAGADVDVRDPVGRTPLHLACICGAVKVVKLLLERKARVSARTTCGRTPMHLAAQYGHPEVVKLLLKRGEELKKEAEVS